MVTKKTICFEISKSPNFWFKKQLFFGKFHNWSCPMSLCLFPSNFSKLLIYFHIVCWKLSEKQIKWRWTNFNSTSFQKLNKNSITTVNSPPPLTDWRRHSLNRTDDKVPEGGGVVCTGTKGVVFVLTSRGSDVVAPRTLCTSTKDKLLDCHK